MPAVVGKFRTVRSEPSPRMEMDEYEVPDTVYERADVNLYVPLGKYTHAFVDDCPAIVFAHAVELSLAPVGSPPKSRIDGQGFPAASNAVVASCVVFVPTAAVGAVADVLAASVVKEPVLGVVAPTVPLSAPPVELSVVNTPVDAVVDPIGPGAANVAPPSCAAFTAVLQPQPVPDV